MVICEKKDLRWNGVFDQEWHLDAHRLSSLLSCNLHRKSGHSQSLRLADTAISAFVTTFSAANSSSEVDQKFFPCICSTSSYIQEPSSAHQFSFYSIFHAFRPFFREVFTVWTRCRELVLKPLCRWAPRRAIWRRPAKIMAKLKRILQNYCGVAPII